MRMFNGVTALRHMPNWLSSRKSENTTNTNNATHNSSNNNENTTLHRDKKCILTEKQPHPPLMESSNLSASPVTPSFLISSGIVNKPVHAPTSAIIKAQLHDYEKRRCDRKGRNSSGTAKKRQCNINVKSSYDTIKIKTEQMQQSIHKKNTNCSHNHRRHKDHPICTSIPGITASTTTTSTSTNTTITAANGGHKNMFLSSYHRHKPNLLSRSKEKDTSDRSKYRESEHTIALKKTIIELLARVARSLFESQDNCSQAMARNANLPILEAFVEYLVMKTGLPLHTICTAVFYLYRLKELHPEIHGQYGVTHRLAFTSLILANKYVDDNSISLRSWHRITRRWFTHDAIITMEAQFLQHINYRLEVTRVIWWEFIQKIEQQLEMWYRKQGSASVYRPSLSQEVGLWEAVKREWSIRHLLNDSTPYQSSFTPSDTNTNTNTNTLPSTVTLSLSLPVPVPMPLPMPVSVPMPVPVVASNVSAPSLPTPVSSDYRNTSFASNWSSSSICSCSSLYCPSTSSMHPNSITNSSVYSGSCQSLDTINNLPVYPGGVHRFKREFALKRYQSAPDTMSSAYSTNHPEQKCTPQSLAAPYPQDHVSHVNANRTAIAPPADPNHQSNDPAILHRNMLSFPFIQSKSSLHLPTLM